MDKVTYPCSIKNGIQFLFEMLCCLNFIGKTKRAGMKMCFPNS
nr:hypothetical protein [uncultured Draconibacterium sp.]